jgi:GT2 family glycosyltransferase
MDLSIIIVNWNSIAYLQECIGSLREHTRELSFEIVVVDNASPAGDGARLEAQFPDIKVIQSAKNLGFAGANNLGFSHSCGEYVLFLNPDTKMEGPALGTMIQAMGSLCDAGILGCKLLNGDGSLQTSCVQTFPTIVNQLLDFDFLRALWPKAKLWGTAPLFSGDAKPARVEVISGACMLMRRDAFAQVGGFTEDYFMYAEDLDLCYKMVRAGYANYYLGSARVVHYGGGSSESRSATQMKWRSIPRFCEKHYGSVYALLFRTVMAAAALARIAALGAVKMCGNTFAKPETLQAASVKWKLVLQTLISPSSDGPLPKSGRAASQCAVQP